MKKQNSRNKIPKTNHGITLIALIITIIILLILAVVSIRLVINNGILGKAEYATKKYTEEEAAEKEKLLESEYEMAKYEGKVTGTCEEYVLDKMYGVKIGDYVNYDPVTGATTSSVTSYASDSGWDNDQTFNLASYKNAGYGWRVLGIENGKIQLISEEFIGPDEGVDKNETYDRTYYYLKGQAGYINGVNELNKICSMYGQGKGAEGARSITVEDVNKITGYNPYSPKFNQWKWDEYTYTRGNGDELSSSGTDGRTWSGTQSTFNYYDKTTRSFVPLTSGSTTIESTNYYYYPSQVNSSFLTGGVNEDGTMNTTSVYQMLFGGTAVGSDNMTRNFTLRNNQDFWLASEYANAYIDGADWGLRLVYGGNVNINSLYYSNDYHKDGYHGVRPVVSLKSDAQLSGSSESGWTIQ